MALAGALMLLALAVTPALAAPRRVRLQLKWYHQFQFAGYYAAQLEGYYAEAGLDVEILEGAPDRPPVATVIEGGAEFGVHDGGDLLYARLRGEPVVALAVVFQHSPYVILSLKDRGIRTPSDLVGRVMMDESHGASPLLAMLKREGIEASAQGGPAAVTLRPHTWRIEDLLEGRADAMSAYLTEEPLRLARRGIEVSLLRPTDYGIDFYGDTLFTTESMASKEPELVEAFRTASMRGWEYAMAHPEEITDHIMAMSTANANRMPREMVLDEAEVMQGMVMPKLVELGHMNPGRWDRMAQEFAHLGVVRDTRRLAGFIPDPAARERRRQVTLRRLGYGLGGVLLLAAFSLVWAQQLRRKVRQRTADLEHEIELRERAQQRLALLAVAMEQAAEDILITDAERVIQYVNPAFEATTGYSSDEVTGTKATFASDGTQDEAFSRELEATLARGEAWHGRLANRAKDGRAILYDATIAAIRDGDGRTTGYVSAQRDVTRQVELETQVEQSMRMQAIGTLAGGIAHDFNNVLAGVLGYAGLAMSQQGNPPATAAHLQQVVTAAQRAADLTKQILAFSRGLPDDARPMPAHALLESALKLVRATIPASVELELESSTRADVLLAPGDLERIVVNLCSNAALAIGRSSGTIRVTLKETSLEDGAATLPAELGGGRYVILSVEDDGAGMPKEVQQRIFEPFFTTRKSGEGSGLGLSVVHGIVGSRGGAIQVQSETNKGTRFDIWLPAVGAESAAQATDESPAPAPAAAPTVGSGRILLVDDEKMLTSLFQHALESYGYQVDAYNSGVDALAAFEAEPTAFDVVVTDLAMPRLRGDDLAARIKAVRADAHVLLCTGNDAGLAPGVVHPSCVDVVLRKPLTIDQMVDAVQAALQSRAAAAGGKDALLEKDV